MTILSDQRKTNNAGYCTPSKRERSKAANREAILDAGRRVFAELGFEGTTVRDIIRGTNLASGTFYNYFKSKEEVFEAIAEDSIKHFRPRLKDVRVTAGNFESYVRGAVRAFFEFLVHQRQQQLSLHESGADLHRIRVDTPEMQVIFEEIRSDLSDFLSMQGEEVANIEYLTASAIGIAREIGNSMIDRTDYDTPKTIKHATEFATKMIMGGVHDLIVATNAN